MYTTIANGKRIAEAQRRLETCARDAAARSELIQLGYQGGGKKVLAHFLPEHDFWIAMGDAKNRNWNALGLGNPFETTHDIVAELNPPIEGINRRVSGAFVQSPDGIVHPAHRGRIGGGRPGIGKKAFLSWYDGPIHPVEDEGKTTDMIFFPALEDPDLLEALAKFTRAVDAFKHQAVRGKSTPTTTRQPQNTQKKRQSKRVRHSDRPSNSRLDHLKRLYVLLDELSDKLGGPRLLSECSGRMDWPTRGIYFFMEPGEERIHSGRGPRIVRVGTHALTRNSSTTLWNRLSQHRGVAKSGSGNHRGSIFRLNVGNALIAKNGYDYPTWGEGNSASTEVRAAEEALEREVSDFIGQMPFLWLAIDDAPGRNSLRGHIERNTIALLSNLGKSSLDPASRSWLGQYCSKPLVQMSELWQSNHVDEIYDPGFLDRLAALIKDMP